MCTLLWDLWCERNNSLFKGIERDPRGLLFGDITCFSLGFDFEDFL